MRKTGASTTTARNPAVKMLPVLLGALLAISLPGIAAAQPADAYPTHPVKLIVPFAAGGPTDQFARLLANQLRDRWGQPIVIDNRGGSGTILGTAAVAKSPPDGYTLGMTVSAHTINPGLRGAQLPYDTLRDLAGVSLIGFDPMALFAVPSFAANNPAEFIALAKRKPNELAYATAGVGTALHLGAELLQQEAGIQLTHVAYKGTAPAIQDVLGGSVPLMISVYSAVKPLVDAGRLKVIGILSPDRMAQLPQTPTFAETYPKVSVISASGMVVRAGTPPAIVDRIARDIAEIMASPAMRPHLEQTGMVPVGSTPQAYDAFIKSEAARWKAIIDERKITAD